MWGMWTSATDVNALPPFLCGRAFAGADLGT
jgi:hypothetical protein